MYSIGLAPLGRFRMTTTRGAGPSGHPEIHLETFGIDVTNIDAASVARWLGERHPRRRLIVGANLHSLYLSLMDPGFAAVYHSADLVIADGFPVAMAMRARQPMAGSVHRVGSTDWLENLQACGRPLRFALLGATPESNMNAILRLSAKYPEHEFRGWDGFDSVRILESDELRELVSYEPDIVLLGLGMPAQEAWYVRNHEKLPEHTTVALVGGAIDHVSGLQHLAPRWLGNLGFEWLWRLAHQPRRLGHRYLIEPFLLLSAMTRHHRRLRRQEVPPR